MAENDLQLQVALAIRRRREGLRISQEAFADQIGLHRTYVSSVERGERNVSLKNLEVIALGLGIPLSKLIAEAEARQHGVPRPRAKRTPAR